MYLRSPELSLRLDVKEVWYLSYVAELMKFYFWLLARKQILI